MKSTHPLTPRVVAVFFGLLVAFIPALNPAGSVQACSFPPLDQGTTWPQNITVQVNIDPAYNAQQRTAITEAFIRWTANMFFNCSMVRFGVPTFSSTPIAGPGVGVQQGQYKLQVFKQNPPIKPKSSRINVRSLYRCDSAVGLAIPEYGGYGAGGFDTGHGS